jgi:hypothetical protein
MKCALWGLVLGLLLALGACGGGGESGPAVIATASSSGSGSTTVPDGAAHIYEVVSVQASIATAPVDISGQFELSIGGGQAWLEIAQDGVAIVGATQSINNGSVSAVLRGHVARPGVHRYSLWVMVSGAAGPLQVSNPSIAITE